MCSVLILEKSHVFKRIFKAFMELYTQILDNAGPTFGTILRHIKDRPTDGVLFHCTAGKDRTGVLAAIILKVCS